MQETLQGSLSYLEIKVKDLLKDKKILNGERDAMAQKIIELQDKLDALEKKMSTLQTEIEVKEQDMLFTSMVVEDLLQELDEDGKINNSIYFENKNEGEEGVK